MAGGDAFDVVK